MSRPRICRRVKFNSNITYFKPAGMRLIELEEIVLNVDEVEAIRLIDHDELEQEKACKMMNISQPTLSRLLKSARKKISQALMHGKAIRIENKI
jgi:uncharacterized protein